MAAINEFSDILSAMEQNPELREAMRNHVLGEELRQLPAVVRRQGEQLAEALKRLDELAATIRDVAEQISSYALASSRAITAIVERQDRVEADIAELKAAQVRLEASVQEMRESLARMEARQDRMANDITELKAGQERIEARQVRAESDLAELKAGQNRMQGQLNNLTGTDYERKVVKRAPRAARRYLGLRDVGVVYGIDVSGSIDIPALLEKATESRAITDEQADEVERADLILKGARTGNEEVFVIAEVSMTIDDSDIDRARNRANILNDASGLPTLAVVVGAAISEANRGRANYSGITVIIMGE
ncbi:MAG: hypothetical protein OXL37_17245 [Chloroflexota bacterium]|nr:hypothetical protein [Chloroflexota bacterium]MDE2960907.1 hypothetical protein [Chloroflexota bacterium]